MFEGDPLSIETHLNNDWSLLLRNLKSKEDHLFELLQYNHNIVNQVREENAELFANDEILQHQKQLSKIIQATEAIQQQQKQILQKYEGRFIQEQRAMKLMGRVGARIFQIYHSSIDKCKGFDSNLNERYIKIRKTLVELLNQSDGICLDEIIKCITKYSKEKIQNELERLKKLILAIQNGEYTKLKEVYTAKERKAVRSVQRKIDVLRDLSKTKADKEAAKTEQKQQQKIRKQKQKFMNNLYSTMQLSKQQFHEDQGLEPNAKIQKLFNEIMARNRYNSEQIEQFHSKKDLFEEKVKTFHQIIEKQSKKVPQVFIRKPIKKQRVSQLPSHIEKQCITLENQLTNINLQLESNIQNMMTEGNIDNDLRRQKKKMNTEQFKLKSISTKKDINDLPNLFNSFLSTNQNFSNFKLDPASRQIYTRMGRNIFPDIGKGTSLDHKTQITKIKIDKILRTTIKNDEKFYEGTQRKYENSRKTAVISREDAKLIQENQRIRMNIKHIDFALQGGLRKAVGDKQKLRASNMSQDHSLHVKKAELKSYQPKLNIIF